MALLLARPSPKRSRRDGESCRECDGEEAQGEGKPEMKLYHFTSVRYMHDIQKSGYLATTNSNIRPNGAGPAVVWLTSNPNPDQKWTEGAAEFWSLYKLGIRITVNVPDKEVHHWPEWSQKMGISRKWYKAFGAHSPGELKEWYVVPRRISRSEWKAVEMWDGFLDVVEKKYSEEMLAAFNDHLASDDAPKWMLDAMSCETSECRGVKPVPVKEWKEAGDKAATKRADRNFDRDMAELRKEMAQFSKDTGIAMNPPDETFH